MSKYGYDLMLDEDGDLILTNGGDLFTTLHYEQLNSAAAKFAGYHHIFFSLADRLETQKGANPFDPEYGSDLPRLVSEPGNKQTQQKIEDEVKRAILEDDRVKEIDEVNITQRGRYVSITVKLTLEGNSNSFQFVFPNFILG